MQDRLKGFYVALDWRYKKGDLKEVEQFLLECEDQTRANGQNGRSELIAVYNEQGSFYRGVGRYAQSLGAFEKAEALAADDMEEMRSQHATILNNMAGTYRLTGDYESAIDLFHRAIEIYRREGQTKDYAYASVLNNLSLTYRETKQIGKAIEYLEQALSLIGQMPEHRQELAVAYNNLTALYYAAGDKNRAMRSLNHALQEFEKCADDENIHYAEGLNSLAGFLYAEGECERAITLYRRSAQYTKRFFGQNVEYGVTCQSMYWVYKALGRWEDAAAALAKAEKVYARLLGAAHERTRTAAEDLKRLREASKA